MNTSQTANKIRLDGIDSGYALTKTLQILLDYASSEVIDAISANVYYDEGNPMHRAIRSELAAIAEEKRRTAPTLGPK